MSNKKTPHLQYIFETAYQNCLNRGLPMPPKEIAEQLFLSGAAAVMVCSERGTQKDFIAIHNELKDKGYL